MATLVDTSIWIEHFRSSHSELSQLLEDDQIVLHPLVLLELASGHLPRRSQTLHDLALLPVAPVVSDVEVLAFIDRHRLYGRGLGAIDFHLLASALSGSHHLLTADKRLAAQFARLT